jgi:hypothetical protein
VQLVARGLGRGLRRELLLEALQPVVEVRRRRRGLGLLGRQLLLQRGEPLAQSLVLGQPAVARALGLLRAADRLVAALAGQLGLAADLGALRVALVHPAGAAVELLAARLELRVRVERLVDQLDQQPVLDPARVDERVP